jgi:hypothetical protein
MTNEELRRRASRIANACSTALSAVEVRSLSEDQIEALAALIERLYQKAKNDQTTPDLVNAFQETLATIEAEPLTPRQMQVLREFLKALAARARGRKRGPNQPPLVG